MSQLHVPDPADLQGRVAKILIEDLVDRQVLLFTHDREWFSELRT